MATGESGARGAVAARRGVAASRAALDAVPPELRRLRPEEAALYRDVRLAALQSDPDAFAATYDAECERPLEWFAERLRHSAVFAAFRGGAIVGIAGFLVKEGPKQSHKGSLLGMYVRPAARRGGIARLLVEAVVAHATRHVDVLQLSVVDGNAPARRLYEALGFRAYGFERHALKHGGRYYDEVLMAKPLAPGLGDGQ
jgi:RimJ/RimL family protein N-acetyltransferase